MFTVFDEAGRPGRLTGIHSTSPFQECFGRRKDIPPRREDGTRRPLETYLPLQDMSSVSSSSVLQLFRPTVDRDERY